MAEERTEMKCPKCGKLLQSVFMGIASDFKNPIEIKDEEGMVTSWIVCTNPDCEDGKFNSHEVTELPF